MSEQSSVTRWIEGVKDGEPADARRLSERYYRRLIGLARRKLGDGPRRAVDEEDLVQAAFASFFRGACLGRFPDLHDGHGLWPLLVRITECKVYDHRAKETRRAGKVRVLGESAVMDKGGSLDGGLDNLAGPDTTPEFAAAATESVLRLLGLLDDKLREVALLKLEGHTNAEIAGRIGRAVATVELRLRMIRAKWKEVLPP